MKKQKLLFIGFYHLSFALLSIIAVSIFDKSTSYEMLSYVIWGNLLYFILGSFLWVFINKLADKSESTTLRNVIRVSLGLVVIYILSFWSGGGQVLIVRLIFFNKNDEASWISLFIHVIYFISFFIASLAFKIKVKGLTT